MTSTTDIARDYDGRDVTSILEEDEQVEVDLHAKGRPHGVAVGFRCVNLVFTFILR